MQTFYAKPYANQTLHWTKHIVSCRVQGANGRVDPDPVKAPPAEAEPSKPSGQPQKEPRVNIFSGESPAGEHNQNDLDRSYLTLLSQLHAHSAASFSIIEHITFSHAM